MNRGPIFRALSASFAVLAAIEKSIEVSDDSGADGWILANEARKASVLLHADLLMLPGQDNRQNSIDSADTIVALLRGAANLPDTIPAMRDELSRAHKLACALVAELAVP